MLFIFFSLFFMFFTNQTMQPRTQTHHKNTNPTNQELTHHKNTNPTTKNSNHNNTTKNSNPYQKNTNKKKKKLN